MKNICTHITEIIRPRLITFEHRREPDGKRETRYESHKAENRRKYAAIYRQQDRWTGIRSEGSGVIAGLTYRQQLAREAIARKTYTAGKRR
jgi:hypothetical protein